MTADDMATEILGTWRTRSIGGEPPPIGVRSFVSFTLTDDGERRIHGSGGVNRIGGGYQLDSDEIVFGPLFTTLMAGPEPAMEHERLLLQLLAGRQPMSLQSDVLTIGERERALVFDRLTGENDGGSAPQADSSEDPSIEILGSVFYRERIALPRGAIVTVRLSDVSRADASAPVLAEQVIEPEHEVPIPFNLKVARSAFEERGRYSLSARITVQGQLRWISDTHIPVSPREPTTGIEVLVHGVAPPTPV